MKRLKLSALLVCSLLLLTTLGPPRVHADSVNLTANANWSDSSCSGSINGISGRNSYAIEAGDDLNLTVVNSSIYNMSISITVAGSPGLGASASLSPGQTFSKSYTNLAGDASLRAQTIGFSCTTATSYWSTLDIPLGSASLACTVVQGNKAYGWNITGTYNNVEYAGSLFEGQTYVDAFNYSGSINTNYTAGTTATPFYFYGSQSTSGRLLAQVTCPAAPAITASAGGGTTKSTAPSTAPATTPTATTPSPTITNSTGQTKPKSTTSTLPPATKAINSRPASNHGRIAAVGSGIVVLAVLAGLSIWQLMRTDKLPALKRLAPQRRKHSSKPAQPADQQAKPDDTDNT